VRVTALVINLGEESWGDGTPGFFGPAQSADVTVPVGAKVEWVNHFETARIVATVAPPGGTAFDSGGLSQDERFEFVPSVAGTWEYVDLVSGATGTLTAQ
jgi:plastocyanin